MEKNTSSINTDTRLKLATSLTGIGVWEYFVDDDIAKLDTTSRRLFGLEDRSEKFSLEECLNLVHQQDRVQIEQIINEALAAREGFSINFRIENPATGLKYLSCRAKAIDSEDEALILLGTIWDITEQKIAENELKRSNDRNKIFVAQAPNAIAMFDNNMRYMAASEQWIKDYNLIGIDLIGKSHYEIFPEISDDWKKIHNDCLKGAINRNEEALFERADGSVQYLKWEVRPWFLSETEIGGILMYTEDITRSKEAELKQSHIESILATTSAVARIGTWEVDMLRNRVNWSDVTRQIHEVSEDFVPDMQSGIGFYKEGESRDTIERLVNESIVKGNSYDCELQIVTALGNEKWVRIIGQSEMQNGRCIRIFGVFQDIDDIRRTQLKLQKVNQELKAILDAGTHVSIISTDMDGIINHFSKGAETLLGYSSEEMVGKTTPASIHLAEEVKQRGEELSALHNREISGFDVFVEYARAGQYENRQWTYIRKDGTQFPVQLIVTGIWGEDGELKGFLGIATDISEIKDKKERLNEANRNLENLANKLTRQNRQLANFAHITSHNLRSPVSNLLTLLNMYKAMEGNAERNSLFLKFESVIHHLSDTLTDLMEALRIQEDVDKEREWLHFEQVLQKTTTMLEGQILSTTATINADFSEAPRVYYNKGYLESIFLNLLSNALKYRSPDRKPEITIKTIEVNQSVQLSVKDNGLGINMQRHGKKLFGLHKTFHRHEEAKGVGLYLTKTQIETMGGSIKANSEVDKGTEFVVDFNKKIPEGENERG